MLLSLLALTALAAPLSAGETPWQDVAPDVRMRLVSSDVLTADGKSWIGIEIMMPETTKTYWRVPGESGIPPVFDFSASQGIGGHALAWPMPRRDTSGGYLDHAYYGHVVLPVELDITASTARIEADVMLGICSDICVPVSASFEHDLAFSARDNAQTLRINQALADVPLPLADDNALGDAVLDVSAKTLTVELYDSQFPAEHAIADIAGKMVLFGVGERQNAGQALAFPVYGKTNIEAGEPLQVHFTFPTAGGPYEIVRDLTVR